VERFQLKKGGKQMNLNTILPKLQEVVTLYGLKIVAAAAIFIVGRWVAKGLKGLTVRALTKGKVDETLVSFLGHLTYVALLAFVIIAAVNQLGVQTTSFIAILGAAGLAVGLALQGSLANFAAGVLMIIFRPFRVGDYIEGGGTAGIVEEIQIFTTKLRTPDNKAIIIPNAKITGDNIVNYSAKDSRRMDMIVGVSYDDDYDQVKEVLKDILAKDGRILEEPAPTIGILEFGDNSVNFVFRPWVKTTEYWDVYFGLTEAIKKRFDEEGITIPYPQRDIHLFEHREEVLQ
jgi:small conductance mechanosensitive channel